MRSRLYIAVLGAGLLLGCAMSAVVASAQVLNPVQDGRGGGGRGGGGGGGGRNQPAVLDPAQLIALKTGYVAPRTAPFPAGNPPTPQKLALGQRLFFDEGLSGNGEIACATCHDVRHGFSDPAPLSIGVKGAPLARRTQPVANLAWSNIFFWDGRAKTLEQQAVMPISNEDEMGMPHAVMTTKLKLDAQYRRMFAQAFPGEAISPDTVGKALAVFERSLVSANSPFDRWVAGDEGAISDQAKSGFVEFNTRAGCAQCHSGWNFSDDDFNDIGLPSADVGRFGIVAEESARHAFKTPSLRNVADRAPYMHTGAFESLQQVLRHYRNGAVRRASLSPKMANVRTRRGQDIIAFLRTLSSPPPPELVRLQEELDRRTKAGPPPLTVAAAGRTSPP